MSKLKRTMGAVVRSKQNKPSVGAVIVNYRTPKDCIGCIGSMLQFSVVKRVQDIVVVDNASDDDSADVIARAFPAVTLVRSTLNAGFGAGVNIGVEHCLKDLVLVLNPDTRFTDRSFRLALNHFDDPAVGVVGLNLQNSDGSAQHSARTFYSASTILIRRTPLAKYLRAAKKLDDQHLLINSDEIDVPWVIGAGFVVRRSAFAKLGGMDEQFFLYLEDTDLCRRMWQAGYKVQIARSAVLTHEHRGESRKSPLSRRNFEHLRSLLRYTAKYGMPLFGHDHD